MMEVQFKSDILDALETDPKFNGGYSPEIVSVYRKRIHLIRNSRDERDFYALTSLHFEKLKGDRSHQYSMRLNKQWRLILEFDKETNPKTVIVIGIEDYH
jgi:toxin HigB-1